MSVYHHGKLENHSLGVSGLFAWVAMLGIRPEVTTWELKLLIIGYL